MAKNAKIVKSIKTLKLRHFLISQIVGISWVLINFSLQKNNKIKLLRKYCERLFFPQFYVPIKSTEVPGIIQLNHDITIAFAVICSLLKLLNAGMQKRTKMKYVYIRQANTCAKLEATYRHLIVAVLKT